jgi:hypothetical protein
MCPPTLLRTPPPQLYPHGTSHIIQAPRPGSAQTKVDDGHDARRPAGLQATPKRLNCCRLYVMSGRDGELHGAIEELVVDTS